MSPLELVGDSSGSRRSCAPRGRSPRAALRERVAALGPPSPQPRWTFRRPSRRLVLGLAAAALLASLVAAGLTRGPSKHTAAGRRSVRPSSTGRQRRSAGARPRSRGRAEATPVCGAGDRSRRRRGAAAALPGDPAPARRGRRVALDCDQARDDAGAFARRLRRRGAVLDPRRQARRRAGRPARPGRERPGRAGDADRPRHDPAAADRDPRRHAPRRPRVAPDRQARAQLETASPQEAPAIRAHLRTLQAKHLRLLRSASLARIVLTLTTPASSRPRPRAASTARSTTPAACSCASCSSCSTRWSSPARCSCSAPPESRRPARRADARTGGCWNALSGRLGSAAS